MWTIIPSEGKASSAWIKIEEAKRYVGGLVDQPQLKQLSSVDVNLAHCARCIFPLKQLTRHASRQATRSGKNQPSLLENDHKPYLRNE